MNKIILLINYWILCFNNSLIFYINKILGKTVEIKKFYCKIKYYIIIKYIFGMIILWVKIN